MYENIGKRCLDLLIVLSCSIVIIPVFLLIAVLIKLDSRGPILFKQKRVGKDKKYFTIYKFRTMKVDAPSNIPTHLLNNPEEYITSVGKFLRKTSLDELPQIINIILGEMSIVGPRPALWNQFDLIEERELYNANSVRPGLTGWAQVNGRDEISIKEKAKLDGIYVKKLSLFFDFKCIINTVTQVLQGDGIVEGRQDQLLDKKRMHVLFIVNHDITIYNFRRELLEYLIKQDIAVTILLPITQATNKISALGCNVINVPVERRGTNPISDFRLFSKYYKLIGEIKPDVVLTYTIKPNIYGGLAAALRKVPYISTITGLGVAIENGGILKIVALLLYRLGLRKANTIFFQNEQNQKSFYKVGIGRNAGKLINGSGVNIEQFSQIPYPNKSEKVIFLFISRIMKCKGIEEFLSMSEQIKQENHNAEFHILGFCEDDYLEKIERYVKKGTVFYHGMQEDVTKYLKDAECLIHPSYYEGLSNVCMEAAAAGRAVIASDIPGCREVVKKDKTGFLVQSQNTTALIEAVRNYLGLPYEERKKMGQLGKELMIREFDRDKIVEVYYKEIKYISRLH